MIQAFVIEEATGVTRGWHKQATQAALQAMPLEPGMVLHVYDPWANGYADIDALETYLKPDGSIGYREKTVDAEAELMVTKADLRQALSTLRDLAEFNGCPTPLGRMDSDEASQRKVNGAATMALIAQVSGQPYSVDWTMQDNSTVTHDAAAMIAAGVAMGMRVSACHDRARALKVLIDAATSIEDAYAIPINTGWPA